MDQDRRASSDQEEVRNIPRMKPTGKATDPQGKGGRKGAYQGRFLGATQPERMRRKRRKQMQKARLFLVLSAFFFILLLVSLILIVHSCVSANPVIGNWKMDSMTSYEFYDEGQGALVVPRGRYSFTYTLEDDLLTIDFHDEKALDSQFTYELEENVLTLVGGNKDLKGTYVLEKQ